MNATRDHDPGLSTADAPALATMPASSARALARLAPGTRLGERYRIVRWLGQGAMGSVYQASDEARSGLQVAVKLLSVQHPQALYRLKNEFRALAQTVHPNLVGLHGLGTDAHGGWFVVMDLIAPCTDFVSFVRGNGAHMDHARLRAVFTQLLRGVAAIHAAGKLHRDLKPSNVLVSDEGRVVIADFGLVGDQEPGGEGHTRDGWFLGTPAYAAPEQALGEQIGTKADMYAVGVLLFEALTGRLPIEGESSEELLERKNRESAPDLRALGPDLPRDLSALCNALLRRDASLRPEASEALLALEEEPAAPVPVASLLFVGRERELSQLHDAALRARSGASLLAVVSGPSGIGKTALVTRFLEELRREPNTVQLRGRCHAHEHLPFNAFDALVDALGRYLTRLDAVEAASLMPRDVTLLARLFPTLLRVPAVLKMPPGRREESDEALERLRAFAALKELLARIADRALLVVCFDDLQWSDEDSRELLRELLRGPGSPSALFVCAARAGDPGEDAGIASLLRELPVSARLELPLAPLDVDAASELARAMLGDTPRADLELLIAEAAGSPFLVKELSRGKSQSGRVASLPETVAAITRRLDADARSLLELICVLRQPVELQLAMRAADVAPQALPEILATSLVRTSLHAGREHLEGSHQRISEAVVAELEPARRAALHERFARVLREQPDADPEQIAHHFRAAGLKREAARPTIAAAERAAQQLAFGRSAELYEAALADALPDERAELELALTKIYEQLGRLNDAAESCERAARHAPAGPERRELESRAMLFFLLAGQTERGLAFVHRLCRELGVPRLPKQRWLAALMRLLLGLRFLCGRSLRALGVPRAELPSPLQRERLEFCYRVARGLFHSRPDDCTHFSLLTLIETRRLRDPHHWPLALSGEAMWRCVYLREHESRYARDLQRSLALAEQRGNPDVVAGVLSVSGICAMTDGRWQEAVETFERAEDALRVVHRSPIQVFHVTRAGRMVIWITTGQMKQIVEHSGGWLAEARALGDHYCELSLRFLGAQAYLAQDEPARARAEMEHVRATLGDDISTADAWWFGDVALYEGDAERALAEDRRARSSPHYASLSGVPNHRVLSTWYRGRAALSAAGQGLNAKQHLRDAKAQARRLARDPWQLAQAAAAQIRAGERLLRADLVGAGEQLERAHSLFTSSGALLWAEATRFVLARLRRDEVGEREAQRALSAARGLGVHNPERWFAMCYPGAGQSSAAR